MSSRVARLFRLKSEPCYGSSLLLFFLVVPSEQTSMDSRNVGIHFIQLSSKKLHSATAFRTVILLLRRIVVCAVARQGEDLPFAFAAYLGRYPTYLAIIKSMLRRFAGYVVCRCKAQHVSTAPQLVYGGKIETR